MKCSIALSLILSAVFVYAGHPNVLFIYGDDVGYGDVGAYGSKMIPTPNIDKLASEGLRFTDGHCSAATCTPSRFSLLTGIHGFRENVRILPPNAPLTIPTDRLTLPKLFKQAGYTTAIVGKWHLGIGAKGSSVDWNEEVKPGPLEVGFDWSFLLPSTNDRVPCVYVRDHRVENLDSSDPLFVSKQKPADVDVTEYPDGKKNPESMTFYRSTHGHNDSVINGIGRIGFQWGGKSALWDDATMSDVFVKEAKDFLATRKGKDEPFFLYFSSQDIHVPRVPHPRFRGATKLGYRGDAMVQFDWTTGELMKALEEYGLADNTIVIFSSDNGPVYDDGYDDGTTVHTSTKESDRGHDGSGIYRGGKYQIYEGGTRVPFIIKWPGKIEPGVSDALVNQIDFLASFAEMFDIELAADDAPDSRSTLSAFLGKDAIGSKFLVQEARGLALREGPWKLIQSGKKTELYNLDKDPSEQNNIAAKNSDRVKSMSDQLDKIRATKRGVRGLELK